MERFLTILTYLSGIAVWGVFIYSIILLFWTLGELI